MWTILDSHGHAQRGQIAAGTRRRSPSKHDTKLSAIPPPSPRPAQCDGTRRHACVASSAGASWCGALAPQYYIVRGIHSSNTCFAIAHGRNMQRACGCDALPLDGPASRPRPGARWPSPGKPRNEACFNRPCAAVQPRAHSETRSATRRPADAAQSARSASPSRLVALGPYAGHTQAHPPVQIRHGPRIGRMETQEGDITAPQTKR